MPIEIKELHVKINVDNNANQSASTNVPNYSKESIVAECVEQTIQIINNLKER